MSDEVLEFESSGPPATIAGRGTVIAVKNPGGYREPAVLMGCNVLIDGKPYQVRGVESFMIGRPYPDTRGFALLVRRRRRCELCHLDMDGHEFGEHMDGHTDGELERWPGGLVALELELTDSILDGAR